MYVVVIPPNVMGNASYIISTDTPPNDFATAAGTWVDASRDMFRGFRDAVQFRNARDAIAFAESHGWTVMNKADDNNLVNVPTSFDY